MIWQLSGTFEEFQDSVQSSHEVVYGCGQVGVDTQEQGIGILVPAETGNDGHLQQPQSPTRQERFHRAEKNLWWLQ